MSEPSNIADLVKELIDGDIQSGTEDNRRALYVWRKVNGDIERAHTKAVFLKEAEGKEKLPTLFVYVDSSSRVVDFNTNQELYVERLRAAGFYVGKVIFKLSRYGDSASESESGISEPASAHGGKNKRSLEETPDTLPELSEEELLQAHELTKNLPDGLREAAFKAFCASVAREKNS